MTGMLIRIAADWTAVLMQLRAAKQKFGRWQGDSTSATAVLILIAIILLVVLAARIGWRWYVLARQPKPVDALFAELARAHGLTERDQRLLKRLARREKLAEPARLFVDPRYLGTYARSGTEAVYLRLYNTLFAR